MTELSRETEESLVKIASWCDLQRKITKWSLLGLIPVFAFFIGAMFFLNNRIKEDFKEKDQAVGWWDTRRAVESGDLPRALSIADKLLNVNPRDFEGHYRKGEILLMMNQPEAAAESFQKAAEIFPIPKYKEAANSLKRQ